MNKKTIICKQNGKICIIGLPISILDDKLKAYYRPIDGYYEVECHKLISYRNFKIGDIFKCCDSARYFFKYVSSKKREITISQIEKKLGFRIKIIGEE